MNKQISLVRLEAMPGYERELAEFINSAMPDDQDRTCYALKIGPHHFGIFDVYDGAHAMHIHPGIEIANALTVHAPHLLAKVATTAYGEIKALVDNRRVSPAVALSVA